MRPELRAAVEVLDDRDTVALAVLDEGAERAGPDGVLWRALWVAVAEPAPGDRPHPAVVAAVAGVSAVRFRETRDLLMRWGREQRSAELWAGLAAELDGAKVLVDLEEADLSDALDALGPAGFAGGPL